MFEEHDCIDFDDNSGEEFMQGYNIWTSAGICR